MKRDRKGYIIRKEDVVIVHDKTWEANSLGDIGIEPGNFGLVALLGKHEVYVKIWSKKFPIVLVWGFNPEDLEVVCKL